MTRSSQRAALFAFLIVAIAGFAAMLTWTGPSDAPLGREPSPPTASQSLSSALASHQKASAEEPREAIRQPQPREVAAPVATLVVRVVDEAERPVPGAEVGVHVERNTDDYVHDEVREERAWAGEIMTADDQGEVRLAVGEALSWTLYGRREELWGVLFVPRAAVTEVQVLQLRRDLTLRAQVLDSAARPVVGARVALGDEAGLATFRAQTIAPTVAPDGIATFRHAQRSIRPEWGGDGIVMLDMPLGEAVYAPVEFATPASEPYLLRLPDTGSVQVTLVDEEQQPVDGLTERVYARLFEQLDAGERTYWLPFDGPRLDLMHVGLGLRFRLQLSSPEVVGAIEFDGPREWNQRVEVSLPVDRQPTMSGRLVDERGVPQQGYWFATHVRETAGFYNQYFETGDDGLFHTAIPEIDWAVTPNRSVLFRRTVTDLEHQAWFDLADLGLRHGRNELGDVVLRPAPTIVAGRVVDDSDRPVAGAQLAVWQGDPEDDAWQVGGVNDPKFASDADGRFEIRGHLRATDLLLRGEYDGTDGGLLPFVAGTESLEYVVPRVGTVEMPVTFAGGLTADRVLFVRENAVTGANRSVVSHYVFEDGVATWRGAIAWTLSLQRGRTACRSWAMRSPRISVNASSAGPRPSSMSTPLSGSVAMASSA